MDLRVLGGRRRRWAWRWTDRRPTRFTRRRRPAGDFSVSRARWGRNPAPSSGPRSKRSCAATWILLLEGGLERSGTSENGEHTGAAREGRGVEVLEAGSF